MARMIEARRAEPGCLGCSYAEDVLHSGLIRLAEAWADRAALDAHFVSDHVAVWRRAWPDPGLGARDLRLYDAGEGRST